MRPHSLRTLRIRLFIALAIVLFVWAALPAGRVDASTCTSQVSGGNWNSAATWSCNQVPGSGDDVIIANGFGVTLNTTPVTVNSLTVNGGAAATTLTISGTNSLTVTTDVTINSTSGVTKSIAVGAGTLTIGGNLNLSAGGGAQISQVTLSTGTVSVAGNINANVANAKIVFSGAGTLNVGGAYQSTGTLTPSTGTVNYNGSAQTIASYAYNNLTLSGSGVKTLPASLASVVNLALSGSASATTAANLAVTGTLNVGAGAALTTGSNYTLGVTGISTVGGTLTLGGTGTKTFTSDVTVSGGGVWNETGIASINDGGSLTNNGTYTANTGIHTFTGSGKTISGASAVSIPSLTINGATGNSGTLNISTALAGSSTLTNNATGVLNLGGTVTINALTATAGGNTVSYNAAGDQSVFNVNYANLTLSGSGTKTLQSGTTAISGNLALSGAVAATTANNLTVGGTLNVGSGTALTTGSNYTFGVTGASTVTGTLTLGGTGAKTFTGDVTVSGGGVWNETGAGPVNNGGNLTNNGSYTANSGAHTFSGATKTIASASPISIPNLTITGATTSTANLSVQNMTVNNTFTNSNSLATQSLAVSSTLTNNSTLTVSSALSGSGTLTNGAAGTLNLGGTTTIATLSAATAGNTVNYNAAGDQTLASTNYANLILSGSGAKTMQSGTTAIANLTVSGTATATTGANLALSGALIVGPSTALTTGANYTLTVAGATTLTGSLNLGGAGAKTFTGDVTINDGGVWNETGAAAIFNAGNLTNNGVYTASAGVHTFSGTGKTITGANPIAIPNLTINGTTTNSGTLTVSTALSGSSTLTNAATGILNLGGNSSITTLTAAAAGNTVNYTAAGDQTVKNITYSNLNLSGSGVKTLQAGTTAIANLSLSGTVSTTTAVNLALSGALTVGAGTSLTVGPNFTFSVAGASSVAGSLILAGTGAKTFTGDVAISSTGIWNETGNGAVNYSGSLANNGSFTANTGVHTFSGAGKTIGGANAISIPNLTINGATTNSGTLTVSTALAGTSSLTNGASAALTLGGTSAITTLTATAGGNTVNYNGSGQTVKATTYNNLIFSGSGPILFGNTTTVSGNLSIAPSGTATASITAGQTVTVHSLTLGGVGRAAGTWGSTTSTAANKINTYFAATTGMLNVAAAVGTAVITFGAAPTPTYLGPNFTVSASTTNTDSSSLNYAVISGPCVQVSSATFSATGAGVCVVSAYGASTANFSAASATQNITISPAAQAPLVVTSSAPIVVETFTAALSASGGSGAGAVTFSAGASTGCTVTGNTLLVTNAGGTCSVTATKAADANFNAVTSAVLPITLAKYQTELNKSFTPISIAPGGTSRLAVTIYNANIFQLTSAAWFDNLAGIQPGITLANPVNLSNTCGGTVTAAAGAASLSLAGGRVPPKVGSTIGSCTVSVDVTATFGGNLINTIPAGALTATDGLGNLAANTTPASATLQVPSLIAPSLSKGFNPNTIWAGDKSLLIINITNNDLSNSLTQAGLTDALPANVVVSNTAYGSPLANCGGASLSAAPGASSVTLTGAVIAPGATCQVSVYVTSNTQGVYTNTLPAGAIQTAQGVTNTLPASAPLNVQQLNLTKVIANTNLPAGGITTVTITLQNPTGVDYTNASLTDSLPAGMLVSGTPATPQCGGAISSTATSVTLTGGMIPHSPTPPLVSTCTIVFSITTPPNAATGVLTNTIPSGSLHDDQNVSNPTTVSAAMNITAALSAAKAFAPSSMLPGVVSTVTITLSNKTGAPLTGVNFTDSLPANLTVYGTPVTPQCGGAVSSTSTTVTLTGGVIPLAPVPPTTAGACTVVFQVTSSVAATYTNTLAIGSIVATGQGVSNLAAVSAALTVSPTLLPVTATKAFQTSPIAPGSTSRLRITLTAPVDTGVTNLSISDTLPGSLVIAASPAPVTNCAPGTLTAPIGGNTIQLGDKSVPSGATLAAGANCTITVYVTSNAPGVFVNTLPANDVFTSEGRTNTAPNSATLQVTSLTIGKAFVPATVNPNGTSMMTITLTNTYTSPLTSLSVTDSLAGMGSAPNNVIIAASPSSYTSCGGVLTATAGTNSITLTGGIIPAQVGGVSGACTINVPVQGLGSDATPRPNTLVIANVTASIGGSTINPIAPVTANLTVTGLTINVNKSFNPLTVFGHSVSTLSIVLNNPNTDILTGISFTDTMPSGMVIASPANLNPGSCMGALSGVAGAGSYSFSGGFLAAGGSCTLTLSVTTNVNYNLTNTIPIGSVTSSNGASNPLAAAATLTNLPGVSLSKFFSPNPSQLGVGNYSLLTLTIQNTGSAPQTGVGFTDTLPNTPGDLLIAASPLPTNNCGGSLSATAGSRTIQLTGGSLAGSSTCTITVPVSGTVPGSYVNTIPAGGLKTDSSVTNTEDATDTLKLVTFPVLTTTPSAGGTVGITLNDTASLTGTYSPTGSITFKLFPPSDPTCAGVPIYTETTSTAPYATTTGFVTNTAGVWRWTADFSGDTYNNATSSGCSAEPVTVTQASPTISTTASPATGVIGAAATTGDSAVLNNAFNPTGSVTFTLYSNSSCTVAVSGMSGSGGISGGLASWSKSWTPTTLGTYYWQASYPGDINNIASTTACTDANEQIVVGKATPALATTAAGPVVVGSAISDTAQLSGGYGVLGGTLTFKVYLPGDTACSTPVAVNPAVSVSGAGSYTSANYTPTAPGDYRWIASYSGDANNNPFASTCNEANETSTVTQATPVLTTAASGPVLVGSTINDTAQLSGGYGALSGTITFSVYLPADTICLTPVAVNPPVSVSGAGSYPSANYTALTAGGYRWIAVYSGDANNAAASTACNDLGETSIVNKATPGLTTTASGPAAVGAAITDTAHLSGGFGALSGTLAFSIYAPGDTSCTTALTPAPASAVVNGTGNYTSGGFTTAAPGTYRWIAVYSGDANNAAASTACNDLGETSIVNKATPGLTTTASSPAAVGAAITDTAHLSGGYALSGTLTFSIYAPGDASCTTALTPAPASDAVSGAADYTSGGFTTAAPGTYRWIAVYSGDANNNPVTTSCNDAGETTLAVAITAAHYTGSPINGVVGGRSLLNVLVNDTLDGGQATLSNVILTQVATTDEKVTLNTTDGSVNVAAGAGVGLVTVTYQICDRAYPTACAINTVLVPVGSPTAVLVSLFSAAKIDGSQVQLEWQTVNEANLVGFNLYRSDQPDSGFTLINPSLIIAHNPGSITGSQYTFIDPTAKPGVTYYYRLEIVLPDLSTQWVGQAVLPGNTFYIPSVRLGP